MGIYENNRRKRRRDRARGSVCVMLAFLMLPVYTLAGAAVDGARASAGRQTAREAAGLAANAALASYDEVLKNVYGLFAVSQDKDELCENLYDYFNETVSCLPFSEDDEDSPYLGMLSEIFSDPFKEKYTDLIGLQTDYFSAEPAGSAVIADPDVMKNQITEYMKYRGPVNLGKSFLTKAGVFSEFKKQNKAVEAKLKYEEDLGNIQELCQKAYSAIRSYNSGLEECGIKDKDSVSRLIAQSEDHFRKAALFMAESRASSLSPDPFENDRNTERMLREKAQAEDTDMLEMISRHLRGYMPYTEKSDGSLSESPSDFTEKTEYIQSLSGDQVKFACSVHSEIWSDYGEVHTLMDLYDRYTRRAGREERVRREAEKRYFSRYNDMINDQVSRASQIRDSWNENADYYRQAGETVLRDKADTLSLLSDYLDLSVKTLEEIIQRYSRALRSGEEWQDAVSDLSEGEIRTGMQSELESTNYSVNTEEVEKLADALKKEREKLDELISCLKNIRLDECTYDYMITDSESAVRAGEDHFSKGFHGLNGDIPSDISPAGPGYSFFDTLSRTCAASDIRHSQTDSVLNDLVSAGSTDALDTSGESSDEVSVEDHISEELLEEILSFSSEDQQDQFEMSDSDSAETGNMLKSQKENLSQSSSALENLAEIASSALAEGRDSLYLTEYITEMFSCRTSDFLPDDCRNTLSGIRMSEKNNVLYKNEVEYILWGNSDVNKNLEYTAAMIFGTRFLLNSVYAFTDSEIKAAALSAATAIAGWTGFGVPVVRTVIILSLALAESVIDVNELTQGKSVVIYKSSSTWNMKPSGLKNALAANRGQIAEMAAAKAGEKVNDVFEKINDIAADKTDELTETLNGLIDDVSDSAVESAANMITGPLEDAVEQIFESTDRIFTEEEIYNIIERKLQVLSFDSESLAGDAAIMALDHMQEITLGLTDTIYQGYLDVREKGTDAIGEIKEKVTEEIGTILEPVRSMMKEHVENISGELREEVSKGIEQAGDKAKEYASDMASKIVMGSSSAFYTPEKTGEIKTSGGNITSAGRNLTLNYKEYLKLFVMLGTFSEEKEQQMLSRAAVVMQMNISHGMNDTGDVRGKSSDFDITQAYTMVKVDAEVKMNMWFTGVFVPDQVSGPDGKTRYSYDYSLFGTKDKNISVHTVMSY